MAIVQLCKLGQGAASEGEVPTPQRWVSGASPVKSGMEDGAPRRCIRDLTSFTPDGLGLELFRSVAPQ